MSYTDAQDSAHRSQWRELSRNLVEREILYFISGSPDGVREPKIQTYMKEFFTYSFQGSIDPHLKKLAADGLITQEKTRSGATIWHANHSLVISIVQKELDELKHREENLRGLHAYLIDMYGV